MKTSVAKNMSTVRQIKQQAPQFAEQSAVPLFWLTDWLLYVIDKPSSFLITDDDYQLTDSELDQFYAGVERMQQGTPLAYLKGSQAFWSLDFKVNAHTLIPRPDTEVLVEQVLNWIKARASYDVSDLESRAVKSTVTKGAVDNGSDFDNRLDNDLDKTDGAVIKHNDKVKRLLDLGTGSGCIAISLAHELQANKLSADNWQVVAVDVSVEALELAQYNAQANSVSHIEFIQSSWYDALSTKMAQRFDVIVSNPPYIDESDEHLARLQAEPISALSAPNQGLADIEHIVQYAPKYLQAGGLLAIEHGYDQGLAVRQLFIDSGFKSVQTLQDYGGNDRVTLGEI